MACELHVFDLSSSRLPYRLPLWRMLAGVQLSGRHTAHVTALSPSSSPQPSDGLAFAGTPASQSEKPWCLLSCCCVICELINVTVSETAIFAGRPPVQGQLADFMDTVNQDLDNVDDDLLYQRAAGNLLCIGPLSRNLSYG